MSNLQSSPGRVGKTPLVLLGLALLVIGAIMPFYVVANNDSTNDIRPVAAGTVADDVNLGSVGTVQGIHTNQDLGAGPNQQNNLNGGSGSPGSLNIEHPTPAPSNPITVMPDPLPIIPVSPCKYLLDVPKDQCQPICNPCTNNKMIACPLLNETSSPVSYPCSPCGYPVNSSIVCRPLEGTPIGQL
jgi:hypothetical protein